MYNISRIITTTQAGSPIDRLGNLVNIGSPGPPSRDGTFSRYNGSNQPRESADPSPYRLLVVTMMSRISLSLSLSLSLSVRTTEITLL